MFPAYIRKNFTVEFSDESELFIHRIFKMIDKYSSSLVPPFFPTPSFSKGKQFHLLESSIQKIIETNTNKTNYISTFQLDHRTINVYLTCFEKHPSQQEIQEAFSIIYIWLCIANFYSQQKECSQILNIYLYWTDEKKLMPSKKNAPLDWIHANTAYTFSCRSPSSEKSGENEIIVYRKEEWFKVLIHETFHSFALDFSNMSEMSKNTETWIMNEIFILQNESDVNFYECYTETWAEIMVLLFSARGSLDDFKDMMVNQCAWSAFQSVKILKHHHLDYAKIIKNPHKKNEKIHYQENTSVFSYYILKTIFLLHVDEFMKWTLEQNHGSLCFKKTARNIQNLGELLKSSAHDSYTNEIMKKMKDYYGSKKFSHFMETTLRMTLL